MIGPSQAALDFAAAWRSLTGEPFHLNIHERLYELRRVAPPPPTPGEMRPADTNDLDLVARWMYEFNQEALPDEPLTLDEARKHVSNRIGDGTYYFWEDGQPVALAGHGRHTPHGCSIGPVYTPLEFRRRGYATALTAALSQLMLDSRQAVHYPFYQPGQSDLQQHLHEDRLPARLRFRPVPLWVKPKRT